VKRTGRLHTDPAKLRAWIARSRPLANTRPPERRTPMRKSNPKRKLERFARAYGSPGRVAWVRSLACVGDGCREPSEAAHLRSRGAGGTADDLFPACRSHHSEQHRIGMREFQARHGIDLSGVAAAVALRWRAFAGEHTEAPDGAEETEQG
jgi:hypothetical protein